MTGEGSFGASFIPVFTGYLRDSPGRTSWALAQRVFWDAFIVLAVIATLGSVFSRQVVAIFSVMGGNSAAWSLAVYLNRIIFPSIFFIGLAAVATSILHSYQVFGLPAATPIFFNLAMVACSFGIVYRPVLRWLPTGYQTPAVALAIGVLIGGAIQLAMQIPALGRRGMTFTPDFSVSDPGVRKVARLIGPAFFGMGVYQINMFVDMIFAMSPRMPSGSVTSLYVSDRVMQLVLGSYAIAVSTALLPMMSHQLADGKWDEMKRTFAFSVRIVSFITIPAAVGLILLREPIIQVLFQHGQFSANSTSLTAHALFFYSLGLPAFAAIKLINPMYYSTQDTMTPARVGLYALGLNIALNALFLLFFSRSLSNGSPALASSLAAYFNFGMLFLLFRKRYGQLGARGVVGSLAKVILCATAMAFAAFGALKISHFPQASHVITQAGLLTAIVLASTGVYFGLARLMRCEELSEFFLLLRRSEAAATPLAPSGIQQG